MNAMTGKEMVKLLQSHGFVVDRIRGSHYRLKQGAVSVSVPVHAGKELKSGTQHQILKEAGLR
jgi:predicted RNA binding protein YcfA (HicA-like mRNA interferase family)